MLLYEYADCGAAAVEVDEALAVIRGVKVLGRVSRNGRLYRPEALQRAAALYEGAKVNVNHPKGRPDAPRDYQDRIGVLRQARSAGDGIFADLHYNPKHPLAEQLAWDARHAPHNVGLSHNVEAVAARQGETLVVESIERVHSVDLVADPAATKGLFEQRGLFEAAGQCEPRSHCETSGTMEDWQRRRTESASSPQPPSVPLSCVTSLTETKTMHDLTLEQLQAQRPDLLQQIAEQQIAEQALAAQPAAQAAHADDTARKLAQLEEEVATLRAERAAAQRRAAVETALAEARLPAELLTETFRQSCHEASDERLAKLIEDRRAVSQVFGQLLAARKPTSREQQEDFAGSLPSDGRSLARLIA